MNYEEEFDKEESSQNPFNFGVTIHRKEYIIMTIVFGCIFTSLTFLILPSNIASTIKTISYNTKLELYITILPFKNLILLLLLNICSFIVFLILNQKRILDIIGNKEKSLQKSYIVALGILILKFIEYILPIGSILNTLNSLINFAILLLLCLMKGKYKDIEHKEYNA